ncbi:MAG TPA: hypothetical protein VJH92_01415 [Candidatus Nanoarchaeia archaeon]|nr:hypothetical protein [Candidatus Nanoarchaeia archaeon]
MKINKTLTGIVLGTTLLGSLGCSAESSIESKKLVLQGKPISVGESYGENRGSLATIIDIEGKLVLAQRYVYCKASSEALALVQSEINDGDNESITLYGEYEDNRFIMDSLTANGYTVDF